MRLQTLAVRGILVCLCLAGTISAKKFRRLSVDEYVDKMKAGWIGQMVGVGWGGPTEFRWMSKIIPEENMPKWQPRLVNQFGQDDIYVEMTFLRTLEVHGLNAPIRQAGIDFANSGYQLWHANNAGRNNLRSGIAPPHSGHPKFNGHADDIDYQIEADYSGLISPGLPNRVITLGEVFGRLMNYGDGLYGGQFVGAMYAEAFFESDMVKLIQAGLAAIPKGSQYHECISDVLKWHEENPTDWQKTWQLIENKYQKKPEYRRFSCSKGVFNIDAKINGAYIVTGMLYGERDPDRTIIISTRCGQDSDCNPSNAGGVLFTTIGFDKLADRFVSALDPEGKFSHTPYNFPGLCEVCEMLARKVVVAEGGRIEKDNKGKEIFVIPVRAPGPGKLEQCWEPTPVGDSSFTKAEMARITESPSKQGGSAAKTDISKAVEKFAPGWKVADCGAAMEPGLRDKWGGRDNVLVTHPLSESVPCVLTRKLDVSPSTKTTLTLDVAHDPNGDWTLVVKANGKKLTRKKISKETCTDGWTTVKVDLSTLAGKSVELELQNCADGWAWEAGYWSRIAVQSE